MALSNPGLKYSAEYDKQWDNKVDPYFRYCQIVGTDGKTTRRFFGKTDRSQAARPQAKQDTERWCELYLSYLPDAGAVVTIDLDNVQRIQSSR
jgi:hypothetical protein